MGDKKSRPVVPGLILIVLGVLFLLSNFGALDLDWGLLWTWIIILMGAIFWIGFLFDRSKDGLIMPGTVLLVVGIVFNVSARSDWDLMEILWPFFILAPALGFYLMYLLGKRDRGVLVPAIVLTVVGLVFLMGTSPILRYLGPIIMIGIGVLILMARGRRSGSQGGDEHGHGYDHGTGHSHHSDADRRGEE
jgi:hypothetical protein